jgi:hypothetical protein
MAAFTHQYIEASTRRGRVHHLDTYPERVQVRADGRRGEAQALPGAEEDDLRVSG